MASPLVIAAVIVLIVLIAFYLKRGGWQKITKNLPDRGAIMAHLVDTPEKVYLRTNGGFDAAADVALRRATGRQRPTPDDHLLAATVLTRNIVAQEHRLLPTTTGAPAPEDLERSRLRQQAFGRAREHYLAALHGVQFTIRAPPQHGVPMIIPPMAGFLVDNAADWAAIGLATLAGNDPILGEFIGFEPGMFMIDLPLANSAAQTRGQIIDQRRAAALQGTRTHKDAAEQYTKLAINHSNDSQNAHDTSVNAALRGIVDRLRSDQVNEKIQDLSTVRKEIKAFCDSHPDRDHYDRITNDVLKVVDRAKSGERNTAIGISDAEALARVWARTADTRNNTPEMRETLVQLLFDCKQPGMGAPEIVCVGGRTSRILSTLDPHDWDERNRGIRRVENHKNEILEKAPQEIAAFARKVLADGTPEEKRAASAQLATTPQELAAIGPIDSAAENAFNEKLRVDLANWAQAEIARINTATPGALTEPIADGIKKEVLGAVL